MSRIYLRLSYSLTPQFAFKAHSLHTTRRSVAERNCFAAAMSFVGNNYDFHVKYTNFLELRKLLEGFQFISNDAILHFTQRGLVIGQYEARFSRHVHRALQIPRKDFETYLVPAVDPALSQLMLETQQPTRAHTSIFFRLRVKEFVDKLAECREKTLALIWYKERTSEHACLQFSQFKLEQTTIPIELDDGIMEPLFVPTLQSLVTSAATTSVQASTAPSAVASATSVTMEGSADGVERRGFIVAPYTGTSAPTLTHPHTKLDAQQYNARNYYGLDADSMVTLARANLSPLPAGKGKPVPPSFELRDIFDLFDPVRYPRRFMVHAAPLLKLASSLNNFNTSTCYMTHEGQYFYLSAFKEDDGGAARVTTYVPSKDQTSFDKLQIPIAVRFVLLLQTDAYACHHAFIGMNDKEVSIIFATSNQTPNRAIAPLMRQTIAKQVQARGPDPETHPFGDPVRLLEGDASIDLSQSSSSS
jgi:hypothetical protein